MSRVRLPVALALLAASLLFGRSSTVEAASLDAAGWWSAANPGPVAVPPLVDVGPGDLLVQGAGAGDPNDGALRHAVAALRFTLADGEEPAALALDVASSLPAEAGAVRACKLTATFTPVENGAWSAVPAHDCATSVLGAVSGTSLVFSGIDALASGDEVAVLLVPEGVTRTVIRKPTASALGVLASPPALEPIPLDLPPIAPAEEGATALPSFEPVPSTAAAPAAPPAASDGTAASFGPVAQFRDSRSEASLLAALAVFLLLSPLAARRRAVIA